MVPILMVPILTMRKFWYYNILLCKSYWTRYKNCVIQIRTIGNHANQGMTVWCRQKHVKNILIRQFAVIPWLTQSLWQQEDCIKWNSHYVSQRIDQKIVRKIPLMLLLLYYKIHFWLISTKSNSLLLISDGSNPKRSIPGRSRALNINLEPSPSPGPLQKFDPEPWRSCIFYYIKVPIF